MEPDLTALCQLCGLCCDGALFGRVPLDPEEVGPARKNGLHVLDNGKLFEQPCAALCPGESPPGARRLCSIYDERPLACRNFTCRLHDRYRSEGGPLGPRVAAVNRVRQLVAELQALGLTPAAFGADSKLSGQVAGLYVELQKRLEDFARA